MPSPYRRGDVVHCPLCGLAHRMGATVCDGCGQELHGPVDVVRLQSEYQRRKRDAALAAGVVVLMLALNLALVRWVGGFVLLVAPLGWLVRSALRMRVLARWLGRAAAGGAAGSA